MPYVSESRQLPVPINIFNRFGTSYYYNTYVTGRDTSSTQYGWRSRGEIEASRKDLQRIHDNANWADTNQLIAAMERVERATSNPLVRSQRDLLNHERNYLTYESIVGLGHRLIPATKWAPEREWTTTFRVSHGGDFPSFPSDSLMSSRGGEMMRAMRPTAPLSNLGQWFGELTSFGTLFRSKLRSGIPAAVGSGYLNWQFGWKPFIGDLLEAAQAVVNSQEHVENFILQSGKLSRRQREEVLFQGAWEIPRVTINENTASYGSTESSTSVSTPAGNLIYSFRGGSGFTDTRGDFDATISAVTRLRAYSTFEYFAYDPDGFLDRMRSYEQKARHLLGLSLTPDLVWELTPWSWLVDWYFDIGGFLSYQVSVESDGLVARRSGTVAESRIDITSRCQARSSPSEIPWNFAEGSRITTVYTARRQRRLPGSPYNMGPTWATTSQQWAILAALGMLRAPGIPAR